VILVSGCSKHQQDIVSVEIDPTDELRAEFRNALSSTGYTNDIHIFKAFEMSRGNATSYCAMVKSAEEPKYEYNDGPWITIAQNQNQWYIVSNGTWRIGQGNPTR